MPPAPVVESSANAAALIAQKVLAVVAGGVLYYRVVKFVTRCVLLPSTVIGFVNGPALAAALASHRGARRVSIRASKGAVLDGALLNADARSAMVYCMANGVCFEQVLDEAERIGRHLHRAVLVFNYRGVGKSTGTVYSAADMVDDVKACLDYLERERACAPADVLVWGHSIGGACGVIAAFERAHPGPVLADRSFAYLSRVVASKVKEGPLAALVAGLIAAGLVIDATLVGLVGWGAVPWPTSNELGSSPLARPVIVAASVYVILSQLAPAALAQRSAVQMGALQLFVGEFALVYIGLDGLASVPALAVVAFALAFSAGRHGSFDNALVSLVGALGWRLDPGDVWAKIPRRALTFHRDDEMISPENSLATAASSNGEIVVELRRSVGPHEQASGPVCHMYSMSNDELSGALLRHAKG